MKVKLAKAISKGEPSLAGFPLFAKRSTGSFCKFNPFRSALRKRISRSAERAQRLCLWKPQAFYKRLDRKFYSKRLPASRQGASFLLLTSSRTAHALHRWCAGYGAPGGCPARPDSRRTAPSPRGSRGSCAASSPRPHGTAPLPAESADR